MGLSKHDSDTLWQAAQDRKFRPPLLPLPRPFYLPSFSRFQIQNIVLIKVCALLDDLTRFNTINNKLLNPPGTPLRNIPIKIYLPTTTSPQRSSGAAEGQEAGVVQASIRTVQGLIAPFSPTRK